MAYIRASESVLHEGLEEMYEKMGDVTLRWVRDWFGQRRYAEVVVPHVFMSMILARDLLGLNYCGEAFFFVCRIPVIAKAYQAMYKNTVNSKTFIRTQCVRVRLSRAKSGCVVGNHFDGSMCCHT